MSQEDAMESLFKWFVSNFEEISRKHSGKAVIVKDFSVIKVFEDEFSANKFAQKNYEYGSYIIQSVTEDSSCYVATIASAQFFE